MVPVPVIAVICIWGLLCELLIVPTWHQHHYGSSHYITIDCCLVLRSTRHATSPNNLFNTVKYVCLDVMDLTTIQAAKETIDLAEGKLDVLVNNAGTFCAYQTSL